MKKNIFSLMICIVCASAQLFGQSRQVLFNFVENPELTEKQMHYLQAIEKNPVNTSHRFVTINHELFETGDRIVLNFNGLAETGHSDVTIRKVDTEYRNNAEFSWRGSVDESPLAGANFVYDKGFVHGTMFLLNTAYAVEPLGEGLHVLIKKEPSMYLEEGCKKTEKQHDASPAPDNGAKSTAGGEKIAAAGDCRIRLLVAFTDDVFAAHANPRGEIQLATDNFNAANQNSNVEHRVELARIMQVTYAESGDDDTDLPLFRNNGDGVMDEVHAARNLYDADMCCLITETLDGCGLASDIGSVYSTAFQVTKYSCAAGNLTFAHEFGHLLNARHDTFVDATAGTNHALVDVANSWRTVMAYNDACDCSDEASPCPPSASRVTPNSPSCTRIQWWSNPSVNYLGDPTGISTRCNNRAAIDNADNGVLAYEGLVINKTLAAAETIADQEEGNMLAEQTIENTAGVNVQYLDDSKGTYRAGTSVTLKAGFWAMPGSDFRAFIDGCTDGLAVQDDSETRSNPESIAVAATFSVAPNPVVDFAGVDYTVVSPGPLTISLIDNMGKVVNNIMSSTNHDTGSYHLTVDMNMLPEGMYYLRIVDNQRNKVVPVVKIGQ